MLKKIILILFILLSALQVPSAGAEPAHIIFLIGDGMGYEQVSAAGMYMNGNNGTLLFETFP
jgi:alkaline phosphatase